MILTHTQGWEPLLQGSQHLAVLRNSWSPNLGLSSLHVSPASLTCVTWQTPVLRVTFNTHEIQVTQRQLGKALWTN